MILFYICPVEQEGESVVLRRNAGNAVTGEKLPLESQAKCASLEHPLLELTLSNGKRTVKLPPCPLPSNGGWKLSLDTSGLESGVWNIAPSLSGKLPGKMFHVEILPDFHLIEH